MDERRSHPDKNENNIFQRWTSHRPGVCSYQNILIVSAIVVCFKIATSELFELKL